MKNDPFKNLKLDAYEQEIEDSLGKGEFKPVKNMKREIERYRKIARYTLRELKKDKNVNIRLPNQVLSGLKAKALDEGLPYQTLIGSILYKYVSGRVKLL